MDRAYDLVVLGGGIVGLWTAASAARRGARVAVVEIGPAVLSEQGTSLPAISFPARRNEGAVRARNHVLGGNSSYWGGGLVRNSRCALSELYGDELATNVERAYDLVERSLGVGDAFTAGLALNGAALHEVAVLPGKKRGLWNSFRSTENIEIFANTRIRGTRFDANGMLGSVTVVGGNGERHELSAPEFVLSMGVIDSNAFVLEALQERVPRGLRAIVGTCLHDHWSVPVASIRWRNGTALDQLFPPKFKGGVVAGRRLTQENGFFHVVADLDTMPPYDRVKALLRVRQQGAGAWDILKSALATCASPIAMLRAGVHYLAKRQLLIPDDSPVRLVLDFESCRSPLNRIESDGHGIRLHWDLHEEDYASFASTLADHHDYWTAVFSSCGVEAHWLFERSGPPAMQAHLREHAVDAYHLGGGLHPDYKGTTGPADPDGRLRGCRNVFISSTAFFCRPGPGNPVLTLLARAEVYVESLGRGERPSRG